MAWNISAFLIMLSGRCIGVLRAVEIHLNRGRECGVVGPPLCNCQSPHARDRSSCHPANYGGEKFCPWWPQCLLSLWLACVNSIASKPTVHIPFAATRMRWNRLDFEDLCFLVSSQVCPLISLIGMPNLLLRASQPCPKIRSSSEAYPMSTSPSHFKLVRNRSSNFKFLYRPYCF